ncbi:MAG: transcriptional regulator FilR1 domain-containing protein [Conexivisphaerales archaeon]
MTHDMSYLPNGFVERLVDLRNGLFVENVSLVLRYIEQTIHQAKEFLWLMSDQPIITGETIVDSTIHKNIPVRLITADVVDQRELSILKDRLGSRVEIGTMNVVPIAMAMNEEMSGFCLPDLEGKIDFRMGFAGSDEDFKKWCYDLYQYYWERSRRLAIFEEK